MAVCASLTVISFNIKIDAQAPRGITPQKKYIKKTSKTSAATKGQIFEKWVNLPKAPLIINEHNRVTRLENVSSNRAVRYQLGCVTGERQAFKVLAEHPPVIKPFEAYNSKSNLRPSSVLVFPKDLLTRCQEVNAQIAVTRVTFDNGDSWNGAVSQKAEGPAETMHGPGTLAGTIAFVNAQNKRVDNAARVTVDLEHDGNTIPLISNELGDYMARLSKGRYCLKSLRDSAGKPLTLTPGQHTCLEISSDQTTRFDILLSGTGLSNSASPAAEKIVGIAPKPDVVDPCYSWHSRVDPKLPPLNSGGDNSSTGPIARSTVLTIVLKSNQPHETPLAFGDLSQGEVFAGIECFLSLQGRKYDSKLSGATRPDVSQTFGTTRTDVAALYYISYLFTQKWDFADAPFLQDGKGKINNDEAVSTAYEMYRQWYLKVTELGLEEARKQKLDPLAGSGITWY